MKMYYSVTIRYEDKTVKVKIPIKELEGTHNLPDFINKVRNYRGHSIEQMHLFTDFQTEDIQAFENGEKKITKDFLNAFVLPYKLPKKIVSLGYTPKQDIENALAHRLTELRAKENYTQEVFATMIGVSRSTYAAYEKGRNEPDIHTLIKIADIYRISLDYLVGRY